MFSRIREDIHCVFERDPAARSVFEVLTCYPGFHALQLHRVSHALWNWGLRWLPRFTSHIARDEYGMSGAVQHGASTLPQTAFGNFPGVETAEIHLATNFQNLLYDHASFPGELRERMYEHCRTSFPDERKPTDTEQQFIYKARKKALGAFKRELWEMPAEVRESIRGTLREQFEFLFRQLRVNGTADTVRRLVPLPSIRPSGPSALRMKAAADDWDLSD